MAVKRKPAWQRHIDADLRRGDTVWCARGSVAAAYVAWLPGVRKVGEQIDGTVGYKREQEA